MLVLMVIFVLFFLSSIPFIALGLPAEAAAALGAVITVCCVVWLVKNS